MNHRPTIFEAVHYHVVGKFAKGPLPEALRGQEILGIGFDPRAQENVGQNGDDPLDHVHMNPHIPLLTTHKRGQVPTE